MKFRLTWRGDRAKAAAHRGAVRGLKQWGGDVLDASQELAPVAAVGGGYLRDHAKVEVDEQALRAAVSYQSPPPKHGDHRPGNLTAAVYVHEDMTAHHGSGKQAKYLEQPLNASKKSGPATVAREVRKALG